MKNRIVQMCSVKETFRRIDYKKEERKQAQKKLECKVDFVEIESRNSFAARKVITSTIKCTHDFNYCDLRHIILNDNLAQAHCLCCNSVEMWDQIVRCNETIELQKQFITELFAELVKANDDKVRINTIIEFRVDVLRC